MFPWPIWTIILKYANTWQLRGVCKRFCKIINHGFRFRYVDIKPILEKGTVEILKLYRNQYSGIKYSQWMKPEKINNWPLYEYAAKNIKCFNFHKCLTKTGDVYMLEKCLNNGFYFSEHHGAFHAYWKNNKPAIKFFNRFRCLSPAISGLVRRGDVNELKDMPECLIFTYENFEHAALSGNAEMIDLFLKKVPQYVNSGFIGACKAGNTELVKKLIKIGNCDDYVGTSIACKKGNFEIFKLLVGCEHLIDDVIVDSAIWGGNIAIIDYLCKTCTFVISDFPVAIVASNSQSVIDYVLANGCNIDELMMFACVHASPEIFKYLISKGGKITEKHIQKIRTFNRYELLC